MPARSWSLGPASLLSAWRVLPGARAAVGRRLLAEFTGTGLLVAVVAGSGIAVTRLTGDGALRLLASSVVTALGLAVLIVVLLPAGGAHFNPVVTAADWIIGRRAPRPYGLGQAAAVMACQAGHYPRGCPRVRQQFSG